MAALECQFIADGPIRYPKLQEYTNADPVLQQIMRYLQNGWPSKLKNPGLKSFASCQQQLSVRDGCLLKHAKTTRIVVPAAVRPQLLAELHRAHVGTDRMKTLAR